jgi:hypothetical protein
LTAAASFAIQTNMKIHQNPFFRAAFLLGALTAILSWTGCATTAGGIAIAGGEKAAGDIFANTLLQKVDTSPAGLVAQKAAVADLTRVGADLKAFGAGTLTPYELGNIRGQLAADKIAVSANSEAVNDVTSILNIFAQSVTGVNGLVLPAQSQVQGTIANAVAGLNASIQTYEGQWNATNPGAWPAPASP